MIPDRMVEQDTLRTDDTTTSVEVRLPWYRALPASCISDVELVVDGRAAPAETIRWTMNGQTFALPDLVGNTEQWWFPTDSAVVSAQLALTGGPREQHTVEVGLRLYIPYIVTAHGVLRIEERNTKTMKAVRA